MSPALIPTQKSPCEPSSSAQDGTMLSCSISSVTCDSPAHKGHKGEGSRPSARRDHASSTNENALVEKTSHAARDDWIGADGRQYGAATDQRRPRVRGLRRVAQGGRRFGARKGGRRELACGPRAQAK